MKNFITSISAIKKLDLPCQINHIIFYQDHHNYKNILVQITSQPEKNRRFVQTTTKQTCITKITIKCIYLTETFRAFKHASKYAIYRVKAASVCWKNCCLILLRVHAHTCEVLYNIRVLWKLVHYNTTAKISFILSCMLGGLFIPCNRIHQSFIAFALYDLRL